MIKKIIVYISFIFNYFKNKNKKDDGDDPIYPLW